jgi:Zn-dependent protease with chaperone function
MPAVRLEQISSLAWEHPADRAALNTLRAIPGFDEVVRRVAGFFGERGLKNLFLANAVRVGPRQRPQLYAHYEEALEALDWPGVPDAERPQLYVTQTPIVNASAIGFQKPFVVMNSGLLELLDRDEARFILAHEIGHIISGHVTYRTIALIILTLGLNNLPFMAGVALLPFQLALLEWYRKSELSADRAGLLGTQQPRVAMSTFLKMAGDRSREAWADDPIDLDAFMEQAAEYELGGTGWDTVLKILNTALRDHPFNTVRAAELQRWINTGAYDRILAGEYRRRSDDPPGASRADYAEAADYYGDQFRAATASIRDSLGRAREAFTDAFRGTGGPTTGNGGDAPSGQ